MFSRFYNFVHGTVAFELSASGTLLESSALETIDTLDTGEYVPIILDPSGEHGEPEIVYVTEHTVGEATATVSRGEEGTATRVHPAETVLVHNLTAGALDDVTRVDETIQALYDEYEDLVNARTGELESLSGDFEAAFNAAIAADGISRLDTSERNGLSGGDLWEGRIVYDLDENILYEWDGSEWNPLSPDEAITAHDDDAGAHETRFNAHNDHDEAHGDNVLHLLGPLALNERRTSSSSGSPTIDFQGASLIELTGGGTLEPTWNNTSDTATIVRAVTIKTTNATGVSWPAGTKFVEGTVPDVSGESWFVAVSESTGVSVFFVGSEVSS